MSILSTHPNKAQIDALIKSNTHSYRELEKEFFTRFGVKISYKAIQTYHTKELGGVVDISESETDSGTGEIIPLDMQKIAALVAELTQAGGNTEKPAIALKAEIAELFAMQLQITKDALLKHTQGKSRYPSEYVRNLQIFSNLMLK